MKIVGLKIENIKRLKAVELTPNGESVVVGGENGQGKSSVLDAILFALGGSGTHCEQPIRQGQDRAEVILDLGDLIVTRRFTPSGSTLVVKNKDGDTKASPQAILDKLVGTLTFDPMEFLRLDAKAQRETLARLAGVDTSKFDETFKNLYDRRREITRNRDVLVAKMQGRKFIGGREMISVADLANRLKEAEAVNEKGRVLKDNAAHLTRIHNVVCADFKHLEQEVERLKALLFTAEASLGECRVTRQKSAERLDAAIQEAAKAPSVNTSAIMLKITEADENNQQVRRDNEFLEMQSAVAEFDRHILDINISLEKNSEDKISAITGAKYPLPGLGITSDAVLFENVPFKQVNTAAQVLVSTAIAAAQNPALRVILIRHGSDLDKKSLDSLLQFAATNDLQVWIERVGLGAECSVIIEDGEAFEDVDKIIRGNIDAPGN